MKQPTQRPPASDPPAAPTGSGDADCLVSWRTAEGALVSMGPLPRERAESLAAVYRRICPQIDYQVCPLPPELQGARQGRVRRFRRPWLVDESGTGH
jgi:hypothetical protein